MLKGGVFGFGGVGQGMTNTINNGSFKDDFRITAVCNRGKPKRDIAEQKFGLAAYEKLDDLIDHGIDFMLILSTSHVHKEAALKCAAAGIPYLLEKPIALSAADAKEIVEATEKAGLINGVNYSMRYSPVYRKMKAMVDNGDLGDVLSVWASVGRGFGLHGTGHRHRAICEPEESGAWIIHHMCHIVDFAIWVAGEVEEVYAAVQSTAPKELKSEEIIISTLKFKNGAVGSLSDHIAKLREGSYGVLGSRASVSEHLTATNSGNVKPLLKYSLETDPEYHACHIIDPTDTIDKTNGLTHFLECLKEERETNVPVREAWYSLQVCEAMRKSAYEGGAVKVD